MPATNYYNGHLISGNANLVDVLTGIFYPLTNPSGFTTGSVGGPGGSGISSSLRSYGWYIDDNLVTETGAGPIYKIDGNQSISGFSANVKLPPTIAVNLDIQSAPTPTGLWASIFSALPQVVSGSYTGTTGTLLRPSITGTYYLRFNIASGSNGAGLTTQLFTIF